MSPQPLFPGCLYLRCKSLLENLTPPDQTWLPLSGVPFLEERGLFYVPSRRGQPRSFQFLKPRRGHPLLSQMSPASIFGKKNFGLLLRPCVTPYHKCPLFSFPSTPVSPIPRGLAPALLWLFFTVLCLAGVPFLIFVLVVDEYLILFRLFKFVLSNPNF